MITTLRRPVIKRCPFKDETDAGELTITMTGEAPELHNLAQQIDQLASQPISHEQFTAGVLDLMPWATVVTRWHTGPWSVEVQAGDDLPDAALDTAGP